MVIIKESINWFLIIIKISSLVETSLLRKSHWPNNVISIIGWFDIHWLQHQWWLMMIIDPLSVLAALVFCGVASIVCDLIDETRACRGFITDHQNDTLLSKLGFCCTFQTLADIVKDGFVCSSRRRLFIWSENHWPAVKHPSPLFRYESLACIAGKQQRQWGAKSPT